MMHKGSWEANINIAEKFRLDYNLHAKTYKWATSLKQSTNGKKAMKKKNKKSSEVNKTDKIKLKECKPKIIRKYVNLHTGSQFCGCFYAWP